MLNFFKKSPTSVLGQQWFVQTKAEGLLLNKKSTGKKIDYQFIEPLITQLQDTGLVMMIDESFLLSWDDLYQASAFGGYEDLSEILNVPETTKATPTLVSFGSLTDSNFEVAISHWQDASGREIRPTLYGAVLTENNHPQLLNKEQWELVKIVKSFASRATDERSDLFHRTQWGKIRRQALNADARLDSFLRASIVLTP